LASGTQVREYLTSGGVVFGVVWQGPTNPDLATLFGASNFSNYISALQADTKRNPIRGATETFDGITVQTSGVPGNFSGRAYESDLIPSGLSADVIQ
jgi:hypothetical protein